MRPFPTALHACCAGLLAGCVESAGPASGFMAAAVSAGAYHTCAIDLRGQGYCWGRNLHGALGEGSTGQRALPTRVQASLHFQAVSAGMDYTCALTPAGAAYCWGENLSGQLGDGTTTNRLTPVPVSGGLAFRAISSGEAHTCGVTTDGDAYCWGAPVGPAPGGGILPNQLTPTRVAYPAFTQISSGYEIVCGVTAAGAPYCWGLFPPGVTFADTTQFSSATPRPVDGAVSFAVVSAGNKHACGLGQNGVAYCWGRNGSGQVGDGTTADASRPVPVAGGLTYTALDAHAPSHSCGVRPGGAAACWGQNTYGQLGTGSDSSVAAPTAVAGGLRFTTLSTGFAHSCGIAAGGALYCWGYGGFGALGTGATADAPTPVRVGVGGP